MTQMQELVYEPFKDPEELYATNPALISELRNQELNVLMGFTGYADAGHTVAQVSTELLEQSQAEPVAVFDVDQLVDYRSRRPTINFVQDHLEGYQRPQLVLYRLHDGLGKPFLFLTGNEPDLQWERFASAVLTLLGRLNVTSVSWAHAVPMPVPHTRPLNVSTHGNQTTPLDGVDKPSVSVQLPSGVGHLLEVRMIEAGVQVTGMGVMVPHYLADAEYPGAAIAALEHLSAASNLMLPTDRLRDANRDVERSIAEQVASSGEVQSLVQRLEAQYDEYHQEKPVRSLLAGHSEQDAENMVSDIEAYLAEQPRED